MIGLTVCFIMISIFKHEESWYFLVAIRNKALGEDVPFQLQTCGYAEPSIVSSFTYFYSDPSHNLSIASSFSFKITV